MKRKYPNYKKVGRKFYDGAEIDTSGGESNGFNMQGIGDMASAVVADITDVANAYKGPDTSYQDNLSQSLYNQPFGGSQANLLAQSRSLNPLGNLTSDERKGLGEMSFWERAVDSANSAGRGALAFGQGSGWNGWAVAGGASGGLTMGIWHNIVEANKSRDAIDRVNRERRNAYSLAQNALNNEVYNTNALDTRNLYIDSLLAAEGGPLETNGATWPTGATFIENGGSHESNPFGGVQFGVASDGIPNLVEEGEVVIKIKNKDNPEGHTYAEGGSTDTDYVLSDRLVFDDLQELIDAKISDKPERYLGMSPADTYKDIIDRSKVRETPNRQDSKDYIASTNERMAELQERLKARKEFEDTMKALKYATPEAKNLILQRMGINPLEDGVYAKGGKIYIDPKNRGKFNATKKRTGKTTEELTHSKNPLTRKRAIFAQNARKWKHKHDEGGYLYPLGGYPELQYQWANNTNNDWSFPYLEYYLSKNQPFTLAEHPWQYTLLETNTPTDVSNNTTPIKIMDAPEGTTYDWRTDTYNAPQQFGLPYTTVRSSSVDRIPSRDISQVGNMIHNTKTGSANRLPSSTIDNILETTMPSTLPSEINPLIGRRVYDDNGNEITSDRTKIQNDLLEEDIANAIDTASYPKSSNNSERMPFEDYLNLLKAANVFTDLAGITNYEDYSNARAIENAVLKPSYIGYTPVTRLQKYTPIDREYIAARLANNNQAVNNMILANALGNPSAASANLIANNYNFQTNLGQALQEASQADTAAWNSKVAADNQARLADAAHALEAARSNQSAFQDYAKNFLSAEMAAAKLREDTVSQASANRSANVNSLLESMGDAYRNRLNRNMVNMAYQGTGYTIDNRGNITYTVKNPSKSTIKEAEERANQIKGMNEVEASMKKIRNAKIK